MAHQSFDITAQNSQTQNEEGVAIVVTKSREEDPIGWIKCGYDQVLQVSLTK